MAREKRRASVQSGEDGKEENLDNVENGQSDESADIATATNTEMPEGGTNVKKDDGNLPEENVIKESKPEISDKEIEEIRNESIGVALEQQREAQKLAFHKLIDDNVKLKREKQHAVNDLKEMNARYEVKVIELDDEKTKCETLSQTVNERERDIKRLNLAAGQTNTRNAGFRRSHSKTADDGDSLSDGIETEPEGNFSQNNKNAQDQKVKDLQYRLVRLANDDEEKTRKIKSLEKEKSELQIVMNDLESQIGTEKMKEIRDTLEQSKQEETKGVAQSNLVVNSKVTIKSGSVHNSKVCNIM